MKDQNGTLVGAPTRLLLRVFLFLACLILLAEIELAQRPEPTPIEFEDTVQVGEPQRVELGEGRYKLVYKNKAGQVLEEEEFVLGVKVSRTLTILIYPSGQAALVRIEYISPTTQNIVDYERRDYDKRGNPQQRVIGPYDYKTPFRRERWNATTQKWDPAPENMWWQAKTGKWEDIPKGARFDSETGIWRFADSGTSQQSSANPKYGATTLVAGGLNTATFTTPEGRINVNLPSSLAAGDNFSTTINTQPEGNDPKERIKNQSALGDYVVEMENQQKAVSAGRIFTVALPAAVRPSFLILRDKKGRELTRSQVAVAQHAPAAEFVLPTLGQQGRAVEISGPFDGNLDTTTVKIGGTEMEMLAESPRGVIARNTSERIGRTQIEFREKDLMRLGEFRSLGVRLSAPKLNLMSGEGTTLTIVVTGLEEIRESILLQIENNSPGVISMGGGNTQRVMIAPGAASQGSYTTERALTGIRPGGFLITATVGRGNAGGSSATPTD